MALARNYKEKKKVSELVSIMLESSFYLDMRVNERLQLIKLLVNSYA